MDVVKNAVGTAATAVNSAKGMRSGAAPVIQSGSPAETRALKNAGRKGLKVK